MKGGPAPTDPKPRLVPGRLLVLACWLLGAWLVWAALRPRLGFFSSGDEALVALGARLLFWVAPSAFYLVRTYGKHWSEPLGLRFPYGPRQIVRAVVLPILLAAFLILGTSANLGREPIDVTQALLLRMRPRLAAPILEELVFRGVIVSEALTWARESAPHSRALIGRFWAAQTGAALLFTSVHWPYWIAVFGLRGAVGPSISLFVTAIVLGFVFAQTRSLYACIFLHFLNNELSSLS